MPTAPLSSARPAAPCAGPVPRAGLLVAFLVLLLTVAAPVRCDAAADARLEYQLKAVFLFNFAKFIEWPPPALPPGAAFRIGVLGDPATHAIIADALKGRSAGDHAIEVLALDPGGSAAGCHVLFVPRALKQSVANLTRRLGSAPILIVGESEGFAADGGIIGFVLRGENIRFQVNLEAAQRHGLRLSSRLAGLAEIVRPDPS